MYIMFHQFYRHTAPLERKRFLVPLWGFRTFVYLVFYKHAAPLGLNEPMPPTRSLASLPPRFPVFIYSRCCSSSACINGRSRCIR